MTVVKVRACAAVKTHDPASCAPGWRQLPPELRRLLADSLLAMCDGIAGSVEDHETAHAAATRHRSAGRPRDAAVDYRRQVRPVVRKQIRSRSA